MKNNDVELIHRILAGDDTAFESLVKKYQKQVHALAWRKIGDFHIAEDITQDTFLKVYQNLSTLKNPNQFSGWLYVIITNQCHAWLRKRRIETEPLEDTDIDGIEGTAYSKYIAAEQAKMSIETQREVVKKLLSTLKESDRTVITLYYFGEMTCEEISRFLGVSTSAIKSRLSRARRRLKKEEPMIREAINNFQISANLTENIMKQVAQWRLPERAKARLGKGNITGNVAFSPDGTRLAVGSAIGIWIYDVRPEKEKELDLFTGDTEVVNALAFSPDHARERRFGQNGTLVGCKHRSADTDIHRTYMDDHNNSVFAGWKHTRDWQWILEFRYNGNRTGSPVVERPNRRTQIYTQKTYGDCHLRRIFTRWKHTREQQ